MKKLSLILALTLTLLCFSGCKKQGGELSVHYEINLEFFENNVAVANQTVTVYNCETKPLSSLYFTLYPLAFSKSASEKPCFDSEINSVFYNGESYGDINIKTLKINGENASFEIEDITLKTALTSPLEVGKKLEVYFEYELILPSANHRFGYGENTVNLTGFYPVLCVLDSGEFYKNSYAQTGDPFYSYSSNFALNLTLPSTYVVAPSLKVESVVWQGEKTTYNMVREKARDIAVILSKNYSVAKKKVGEIEVTYYYFNDANFTKTLETACDCLEYYINSISPYPYLEYAVCQADFYCGGMEYSGLSLISSSERLNPTYVIAHETAHQWWHAKVGFNESEIAFLDEGLTELATANYLNYAGIASYESTLKNALSSYALLRKELIENGVTTPPIMVRNLKSFSCSAEYVAVVYNRSFIALSELKKQMGDKKFARLLTKFSTDFAFKNATLNNFVDCANKIKRKSGKVIEDYAYFKNAIK